MNSGCTSVVCWESEELGWGEQCSITKPGSQVQVSRGPVSSALLSAGSMLSAGGRWRGQAEEEVGWNKPHPRCWKTTQKACPVWEAQAAIS